jgi:hypothetical protein
VVALWIDDRATATAVVLVDHLPLDAGTGLDGSPEDGVRVMPKNEPVRTPHTTVEMPPQNRTFAMPLLIPVGFLNFR